MLKGDGFGFVHDSAVGGVRRGKGMGDRGASDWAFLVRGMSGKTAKWLNPEARHSCLAEKTGRNACPPDFGDPFGDDREFAGRLLRMLDASGDSAAILNVFIDSRAAFFEKYFWI
jgi:hypothetical protein